MKKIYIGLMLIALSLVSANISAQCSASFIYYSGPNGSVTYTSTSTPATSLTTYNWYFGDGGTYSASGNAGATIQHQYNGNANFVVTLIINNASAMCTDSVIQTIAVTNFTPPGGCSLSAGCSNYLPGGPGNMNFTNNSTGTLVSTTYTWNYGDGSPNTYAVNGVHTFTANGNYTVTLFANNNTTATCVDSYTIPVVITNACNLAASFTTAAGANGQVNFGSTSTGTAAGYVYQWLFGDGGNATGANVSHTYANGNYIATLTVKNQSINATCIDTANATIAVSNNTCLAQAAFTFTQGAAGLVNFTNLSSGANANTTYTWNFGNGTISNNATNPAATYTNGGGYVVTLTMSNGSGCSSTAMQTISISNVTCTANSNFTLTYGGTPGVWNATPAYPWNVVNSKWTWGDGSTSFGLSGTHNYSVSGNYVICLSVTVSCGDTATSCSTYSVYRSAAASMVQINVTSPQLINIDKSTNTGIANNAKEGMQVSIAPNPSQGLFTINTGGLKGDKITISIFDAMGREVFNQNQDLSGKTSSNLIDLSNCQSGVYFVHVKCGEQISNSRIVVQH